MIQPPSFDFERTLAGGGPLIGMDEVGRGALAGPVAVGACLAGEGDFPAGLTDSKLLTPARRTQLFPEVATWARALAVGMASAAEVDALGITGALRLAGVRALETIARSGVKQPVVLLDGSHDWLSVPEDLFGGALEAGGALGGPLGGPLGGALDAGGAIGGALDAGGARSSALGSSDTALTATPSSCPENPADLAARLRALRLRGVVTRVKADLTCVSVAAASVAAKVARDNLMATVPDPGYGFAQHKGYGAKTHRDALTRLGASPLHRWSWNLGAGVKVDKR